MSIKNHPYVDTAVILAGGLGTRIVEETHLKPKPMIEIGGRPILWHIMKIYSHFGINNFIICCGYKGYVIKEYFSNYSLHHSDITFDFTTNTQIVHSSNSEPWKITLSDTGDATQTGGRLKRIGRYLDKETQNFCLTYGDGLSNVNIAALIQKHLASKNMATVTAVSPPGRFGILDCENSQVLSFNEKQTRAHDRINGGFFVLSKSTLELIEGDESSFELDVLPKIASAGNLGAFNHDGFWQPMDTLRDMNLLNDLWSSGSPPWKVWSDPS